MMKKKKKRWVLALAGIGVTLYAAYTVLNSPSIVKTRKRFSRILGALDSLAGTVSDSADAIGILSKDFKTFLGSDSDQIPQSLKQLSKLARSDEFHDSLARITTAVTAGVYRGCSAKRAGPSFSDKVIDRLFSEEGSGFASVVVGSFSRNLVMSLYTEWWHHLNSESDVPKWVKIVCQDNCTQLLGDLIRALVSTAVTVYLDKTMNINPFDDLFSGLTNPKHETRVREMLVSLCNTAVETYLKTSNSVSNPAKRPSFHDNFRANFIPASLKGNHPTIKNHGGWEGKMATILAMPTNRNLVLDMTRTVTSQTVRSFLEFLLQKLSNSTKTSVNTVQQEVVDTGIEAMRYATDKSAVVSSLCLTWCLYILDSPWSFVPS